MSRKAKPANHGPEPEDDSEFEQANKGSAEGLGGGPGDGLDDDGAEGPTGFDGPVGVPGDDTAEHEPIPPARAVTAEDPVKEGKLFACHSGKVSLITEGRTEGTRFDCDPGCVVEMKGQPSSVNDLRREDKVKLFGNPVIRIEATR